MKPIVQNHKRHAIVYDADRIPDPGIQLFSTAHWRRRNALRGAAKGRGSTLLIDTPFGPAVLRRYLRGGWPARIVRDRYLFLGWERSRPFREFRLLNRMKAHGLPVPAPLAALCERFGMGCRGAILMDRIDGAESLQEAVFSGRTSPELWKRVGAVLRRFHDAGVHHADLNMGNILADTLGRVFLVDFDRGRFRPGKPVRGHANLARLKRSMQKYWPAGERPELQQAWEALVRGYGSDA